MSLNWYKLAIDEYNKRWEKVSPPERVLHNVKCEGCGDLIRTYILDKPPINRNDMSPSVFSLLREKIICNKCKKPINLGLGNGYSQPETSGYWDNAVRAYEG